MQSHPRVLTVTRGAREEPVAHAVAGLFVTNAVAAASLVAACSGANFDWKRPIALT